MSYRHTQIWNVEGLIGKLENIDFVSKIKQFDLVSQVEIWLLYGNANVEIDGYFSFSKCHKQVFPNSKRNSKRNSGKVIAYKGD